MYDINAYNQMMQKLKGGIIVSCQSKEGDPTHCPEFMAAFAKSAEIGGAAGIRANSVVDIEAIKKITDLPVIGIWKRHWVDEWWNIMITPTFADCKELADAGADIIAIETTGRKRPNNEDVKELVDRVRNELNVPVMADCHNMEDAMRTNADIIAPTLSGVGTNEDEYTPPWAFIEQMVKEGGRPVIAEGHFWEPAFVECGTRFWSWRTFDRDRICDHTSVDDHGALRPVQSAGEGEVMTRYALGIDAGATNLRCALVNDQGQILFEIREPSKGIWNGPAYMDQLTGLAQRMLAGPVCQGLRFEGLGIGTCGQVNLNGELFGHNGDPSIRIDPPVPIAAVLSARLGMPVKVVNDGQAAIFAEAIFGAGRDVQNVVGFTIGTGIGGGIVLNKRIYQGAQGFSLSISKGSSRSAVFPVRRKISDPAPRSDALPGNALRAIRNAAS